MIEQLLQADRLLAVDQIDAALEPAVASVMDCKPNAFVLGISALAVWGGDAAWGEDLKRRIRKVAGFDIPVAIATDAVFEALRLHGVKRRIAIMEPYYPCIEPKMVGVFGAKGYEVVRYNHMRGKSPTSYSVLTAQDMPGAGQDAHVRDVDVAIGADGHTARREQPGARNRRDRASVRRDLLQRTGEIASAEGIQEAIGGDLDDVQAAVGAEGNADDVGKAALVDRWRAAGGRHAVDVGPADREGKAGQLADIPGAVRTERD